MFLVTSCPLPQDFGICDVDVVAETPVRASVPFADFDLF